MSGDDRYMMEKTHLARLLQKQQFVRCLSKPGFIESFTWNDLCRSYSVTETTNVIQLCMPCAASSPVSSLNPILSLLLHPSLLSFPNIARAASLLFTTQHQWVAVKHFREHRKKVVLVSYNSFKANISVPSLYRVFNMENVCFCCLCYAIVTQSSQ